MNMNFYHMTHGYSNHYARAKGRIGKYERQPCEVCEANHIIELENTRVEIHGKKHADYYWIPGRHIISPAFQQLLEENNVSGYHLQDIQLVDCDDFSQEGLKELVVTGRSGYLKVINGNYFIHSEGITDLSSAKTQFHTVCATLWNAPERWGSTLSASSTRRTPWRT